MKSTILLIMFCIIFAGVWAGCSDSPTDAGIPQVVQIQDKAASDYKTFTTRDATLIRYAVSQADWCGIEIRDISTIKQVWYVTVHGLPQAMSCYEGAMVMGMGFEILQSN